MTSQSGGKRSIRHHHLVQPAGVKATIWPPAGQLPSLPQQPAGSLCWIPLGASEAQTSITHTHTQQTVFGSNVFDGGVSRSPLVTEGPAHFIFLVSLVQN